jgi:TonB-dependent SusC/RagA subfamily outer membrane receptor
MLTIAYYFLQVMVCSGIMFGYYWLVLRNKRFHQYNRFYLLAITVLAWVVPLIKIQWSHPEPDNAQMMQLLAVLADNNSAMEESIGKGGFEWSNDLFVAGLYITVSAFFLVMMVRAMLRLYALLRKHSCRNVGDVYLILTQAKGTPFSFFRYIFWNDEIDIRSEAGRQILQHELTHVKQRHSIDKVFMQVVLAAGWFNPFFWLIKKEMEMIHEFIADKSAVSDGDTSALANMLLTTVYPKQQFALANPFFFSPIRRRLLMLTNNANPRFSYIRRLVVLPLLGMVVVLFAFRNKDRYPTLSVATVMEDVVNTATPASEDASEGGPADVNTQPLILQQNNSHSTQVSFDTLITQKNMRDVLIILDGERIGYDALQKINPLEIESINVIKNTAAEALYGKDGANGVIKITTKKNRNTAAPVQIRGTLVAGTLQGLHSFSVTDAPLDSLSMYNTEPLIYVDGEKCEDDLRTLDVTDIASVSVLKGGDAIGKYGIAARNGVVEITSKSGTLLRKARTEKVVEGKLLSQTVNGIVVSGYQSTQASGQGVLSNITAVNNLKVSGTITGGTFSGTLAPGRGNTVSNGVTTGTVSATTIPMSEYLRVTGYPAFARSNDNPPSFPGGPVAWEKYVTRKMNKHVARDNHAPKGTYTVGVAFSVSKNGEVGNVRAENNPGYGTADEAVRLVNQSPNWKPGERNGASAGYMSHRVYITFIVK